MALISWNDVLILYKYLNKNIFLLWGGKQMECAGKV
jgi:hypothetical protein